AVTATGTSRDAIRWRPTRAGLLNVWRFKDETFELHRGRLLLRGPNGAGKSMALELLFPFLLDADASPFKLTSGVRGRGGLFERVMTGTDAPTRVGFAWGAFRRATRTSRPGPPATPGRHAPGRASPVPA